MKTEGDQEMQNENDKTRIWGMTSIGFALFFVSAVVSFILLAKGWIQPFVQYKQQYLATLGSYGNDPSYAAQLAQMKERLVKLRSEMYYAILTYFGLLYISRKVFKDTGEEYGH